MNRFHTIRRLAVIMTGLMGALLAFCAGAGPAAFAACWAVILTAALGWSARGQNRPAGTSTRRCPPTLTRW